MTPRAYAPLLAALLCWACGHSEADQEIVEASPVAVRVARVQRGPIASVLTVSGETEALRTLRLASPVAGRITQLSVRVGDPVAGNAIVARVLPAENEATLHGLDMLRDSGALGTDERALAQRHTRELAGSDIPLRVPFAAVVAQRLHNPGEHVAANEVLLEAFDPRSLVVIAEVPVDAAGAIRPGQRAEIRAGGVRTGGTISALASVVTPQSLTVPVRIAFDTPLDPPLLHAAVEARIVIAEHPEALLIPRHAVLTSDGAEHGVVMVVLDGRAVRRTVRLGFRAADQFEILDGLAAGDLVVTEGGVALPDGAAIAAQPAAAS